MTTEPPKSDRELRADQRDALAGRREARADVADASLQARSEKATTRESHVTDREDVAHSSITFLKFLVVVLIVISTGNFIRTFQVQESTEKATKAAETAEEAGNKANIVSTESRDASLETLNELHIILENFEAANAGEPELQNQAIIDGLASIARMEGVICGGRCPDPEDR